MSLSRKEMDQQGDAQGLSLLLTLSKPLMGVLWRKIVSCSSMSLPLFALRRFSPLATRAQLPSIRGLRSMSLFWRHCSYASGLIFNIFNA